MLLWSLDEKGEQIWRNKSRGSFSVVTGGDARSGKPIRSYQTEDVTYIKEQVADFDEHDHFDGDAHVAFLSSAFLEEEKKALSLVISIDIAVFGKNLLKNFFIK